MRLSFEVAVKQQLEEEENEKKEKPEPWLTFGLLGEDFTVPERPTPSQNISVIAALAEGGAQPLRAIFAYLDNILLPGESRKIRRMIERKQIEFDLLYGGDELNEEGIVDRIMALASENPTEEPTDSSSSQGGSGRRSTGRSPGRGSTRSS